MQQDSGRSLVDKPLALVVDQDVALRTEVREALEEFSLETLEAKSGSEARERLRDRPVDLLVVGNCGPEVPSVDLARHALDRQPPPVVIMTIAESELGGARGFLDIGVFDVVTMPLSRSRLELLAARARRQVAVQQEVNSLQRRLRTREGYDRIVGRSPAMERLRQDVERLGDSATAVWLFGEAGTGKKLVARSLHSASQRRDCPFVVVHCAGLENSDPQSLWSRSFAEEANAEPGWFERADGGSLFLDGISELPLAAQESLVRTLRNSRRPDVRLVVASSGSPRQAIEDGQIVEELREALASADLALTSLAERPEDLALLARHFISTIGEINNLPPMRLAPEALSQLENYHWPGNVRELRNAIEHAVILATDGVIRVKDLPDHLREKQGAGVQTDGASVSTRSFREAKRDVVGVFEQAYLADLLRRHEGNVTSASQQAGMLRSALQRLLRKYGLKSADFRQSRGGSRRRGTDNAPRNADNV